MKNFNLLNKKTIALLKLKTYYLEFIICIIIIFTAVKYFLTQKPQPIKNNINNINNINAVKLTNIDHNNQKHSLKEVFFKKKPAKKKNKNISKEIFIPINYSSPDIINEFLTQHAKFLLTKNGRYFFDSRINKLWVQDNPQNLTHIINIMHELDIPTKQIMIETRIINIVEEANLSIGFGAHKKNTLKTFMQNSNIDKFDMDLGDFLPSHASLGLSFSKIINSNLLDLKLAALEASNKAKIIASPKISSLNHQTATIESGEDIPYQESSTNGGTTTNFKKAVLSLQVTPHILPNKKLLLNLKIQQDLPSSNKINGVPSVITKSMKTHALIKNGETIIIGGIYQVNFDDQNEHIPLWGDLPLLKKFVNKRYNQKIKEQLVIFITPRII